jgi:hypothetical protein
MNKWRCRSPNRSGFRRSGGGRLGAIERQAARHDPDCRDEDRDPDDPRRDALVSALAVASAEEPIRRQVGDPIPLSKALNQLRVLIHGKGPPFSSVQRALV